MLSILIPIYNYNAFPLVQELHKQCVECNIDFEIICIDDASTQFKTKNNAIQSLTNCSLLELSQNIGRSKIRNLLASKTKYKWLLFLDCDTFPTTSNFISKYIEQISTSVKKAFFGGIIYSSCKPQKEELLRWVYGKKREEIKLAKRKKKPYQCAFVSNFLIQKSIFESILFDAKIENYGYEDFSFIKKLNENKISIEHIENPSIHLNLETSTIFITKTNTALKTLLKISEENSDINTKITKAYKTLRFLTLDSLVSKLFQKTQFKLEGNLTSKKPSLIVFDLYKIGYFCYLNNN